jgi:hypothetical protein
MDIRTIRSSLVALVAACAYSAADGGSTSCLGCRASPGARYGVEKDLASRWADLEALVAESPYKDLPTSDCDHEYRRHKCVDVDQNTEFPYDGLRSATDDFSTDELGEGSEVLIVPPYPPLTTGTLSRRTRNSHTDHLDVSRIAWAPLSYAPRGQRLRQHLYDLARSGKLFECSVEPSGKAQRKRQDEKEGQEDEESRPCRFLAYRQYENGRTSRDLLLCEVSNVRPRTAPPDKCVPLTIVRAGKVWLASVVGLWRLVGQGGDPVGFYILFETPGKASPDDILQTVARGLRSRPLEFKTDFRGPALIAYSATERDSPILQGLYEDVSITMAYAFNDAVCAKFANLQTGNCMHMYLALSLAVSNTQTGQAKYRRVADSRLKEDYADAIREAVRRSLKTLCPSGAEDVDDGRVQCKGEAKK